MERSKSSLLYWYPKIKDLGIPTPRTEIVTLTTEEVKAYHRGEGDCFGLNRLEKEVKKVIETNFSLPVFLRTDEFSNKHLWWESCYLDNLDNLQRNLFEIICGSKLADIMGLPIEALVVREFIQMDTRFKAFYGEMPVNPERRYFIRNEKLECHHPYWIKDAVERGTPKSKLPTNWRELAEEMNLEAQDEIDLLSGYSIVVATNIGGYWSVDFCKAKDGRWILIDMAEGEKSWHPSECKYSNMPPEPKRGKITKPAFDFLIEKE